MPDPQEPFRFMDLPAEIRNKIYRELLCNFTCDTEPDGRLDSILARLMREKELINGVCEAAPDVTISILLANRQIYREAYDVMVKTNQFIRVRGRDFNFSELLVRGQLPVVTMDRARAAQFRGYLLCMDLTDVTELADDVPVARFDFMILGRHWDALCRGISYQYSALMDFCFHLDFDPASPTVQETSKTSVDNAFMMKTQKTLLYSFRTHVRGVHTLEISGVSTELSESVKREVAQTPFDDLDACFGRLEQKCQLGRELMEQKKTIEASVVWTNILGELSWVYEEINGSQRDRCHQIIYTCQMGEARCFLHHLEHPPAYHTDFWLETMTEHVGVALRSMDHTVAKIRSAAKTDKTTGDAMGAKTIILWCRVFRLKTMRSNQPMPLAETQMIARMLGTASQLAPHDEELEEEIQKLYEMSGLDGLTLDEIANAL